VEYNFRRITSRDDIPKACYMFWTSGKEFEPVVRFVGGQGYWQDISGHADGDLSGFWAGPISGSFTFEDDTEKETDRFIVVDRMG